MFVDSISTLTLAIVVERGTEMRRLRTCITTHSCENICFLLQEIRPGSFTKRSKVKQKVINTFTILHCFIEPL